VGAVPVLRELLDSQLQRRVPLMASGVYWVGFKTFVSVAARLRSPLDHRSSCVEVASS
jgi:hypothetical protein